MDAIAVVHEPERRRFVAHIDGESAYVEYLRAGDVLTLTHTWVPEAYRGRGFADAVVRAALDHARAHGLQVRPHCPYTDAWMHRHPDYADLRA